MVNRTEIEMSHEFEVKVAESVVVRPGDTLVIRTSNDLTMEEADHIRAAIRERLPGVEVLIIGLDGEMVVYRTDGGTR